MSRIDEALLSRFDTDDEPLVVRSSMTDRFGASPWRPKKAPSRVDIDGVASGAAQGEVDEESSAMPVRESPFVRQDSLRRAPSNLSCLLYTSPSPRDS